MERASLAEVGANFNIYMLLSNHLLRNKLACQVVFVFHQNYEIVKLRQSLSPCLFYFLTEI